MISLIEYFDCGNLYKSREAFEYRVDKFSDELAPRIKLFPSLINIELRE